MTSVHRIAAIILILVGATASWQVLGSSTNYRTDKQHSQLGKDLGGLWGSSQTQAGPTFGFTWETQRDEIKIEEEGGIKRSVRAKVTETHQREVSPERSDIDVNLGLDQRRRGLIWYSLYGVTFDGRWSYRHEAVEAGDLTIAFRFPAADAIFDDFRFVVNGTDLGRTVKPEQGLALAKVAVQPGQVVQFQVHYRTRGMTSWRYQPQGSGVANLRGFTLKVRTDFADIDYPESSLSPSQRDRQQGGWLLLWQFKQVLTGQGMGVVMPSRIQPGELATALSRSAPISLLFFFLVVFSLAVLRNLDIHPVNYLGIAAGFFSFHLLFAYSVDHLSVGVAFALASLVSLVLVATYLRLVVSSVFAYREAAFCQLVYQVGFSAAHFLPGYTGLTVTVLAILTLFILMQLTGRVRWSEVFVRRDPSARPASAVG